MTGKKLPNKIGLFLLLWLLCLPGPATCADNVALLLSDSLEIYHDPIRTFSKEVGFPVKEYNLYGDISTAPAIRRRLFADRPVLILAAGAKAAYVAKVWTKNKDIPVIFIMVLNWQHYKLLENQDNMTGVSMEISPGTQLANMAMFTPQARKIGVIYSSIYSAEMMEKAEKAAAILGLELVTRSINHPKEFKRTFKELYPRVDGFWMLNDPLVFSLDNATWFKERCIQNRLICVGQSETLAQFGLLLTINPDIHHIGSQAASMARNILLHGQNPKDIGVMAPVGTRISINMKTAQKIGLPKEKIPLDLATDVFN